MPRMATGIGKVLPLLAIVAALFTGSVAQASARCAAVVDHLLTPWEAYAARELPRISASTAFQQTIAAINADTSFASIVEDDSEHILGDPASSGLPQIIAGISNTMMGSYLEVLAVMITRAVQYKLAIRGVVGYRSENLTDLQQEAQLRRGAPADAVLLVVHASAMMTGINDGNLNAGLEQFLAPDGPMRDVPVLALANAAFTLLPAVRARAYVAFSGGGGFMAHSTDTPGGQFRPNTRTFYLTGGYCSLCLAKAARQAAESQPCSTPVTLRYKADLIIAMAPTLREMMAARQQAGTLANYLLQSVTPFNSSSGYTTVIDTPIPPAGQPVPSSIQMTIRHNSNGRQIRLIID